MTTPYWLYQIVFPNGKFYFGMTKNPNGRWKNHRVGASGGYKSPLLAALRKYGTDNVKFQLMVMGEEPYISYLENTIIKTCKTQDRRYGYNIRDGGLQGNKFGEESRKKMSDYNNRPEVKAKLVERNKAKKGQKWNLESIQRWKESQGKIIPWNKGIPCSEEQKRKISKKLKGTPHSPERIAKSIGRKVSVETRKKLSIASSRPCKIETKRKISESHRGMKYNKEFGEKQRSSKKTWWANTTPEIIKARSDKMRATKKRNKELSSLKLCGGESPVTHNKIVG